MSEVETTDPTLTALYLAEEQACGDYLAAFESERRLRAWIVSLHQRIEQQPGRADYREALTSLARRYFTAKQRTNWAHAAWQRAQLRTDGRWTDTTGRTRGQVAVAGKVA
jgi:hypothetical protein